MAERLSHPTRDQMARGSNLSVYLSMVRRRRNFEK